MLTDDRRVFQRLRLARPILGFLDRQNALILDIGVGGAFIEHYGVSTSRQSCRLKFLWQGNDIEYACQVARTLVIKVSGPDVVSHTSLRFIEPVGDSEERLRDLVATFVGTVLAAQKANRDGLRVDRDNMALMEIGGARRARMRGFQRYRMQPDGMWIHTATRDPIQPPDGFTVAAYELVEELEVLCRAYEIADEEGRRLIRLVAEMSVQTVTAT